MNEPFKDYLDAEWFRKLDPFKGQWRQYSAGALENDEAKFELERHNFVHTLRCCEKPFSIDSVGGGQRLLDFEDLAERGYIEKAWVLTDKGEETLKDVREKGRDILPREIIRRNKELRYWIEHFIDTGCDRELLVRELVEDNDIQHPPYTTDQINREIDAMIKEDEIQVRDDGSLR